MKTTLSVLAALAGPALLAPPAASAEECGGVNPTLDARYRFENVDQDGFDRDADASTLRLRLGLEAAFNCTLDGFIEFEDVRTIGPDDYNSTANGKGQFPVVADPEETELNRAWLRWRPADDADIKLGRQRIILDNARFVGNVGFRQNEQTFDALRVDYRFGENWVLRAMHVDQVNRIFGDSHPDPLLAEFDVNTQLVNLGWSADRMTLTGYAYLYENEDIESASTETYGLRWTGNQPLEGGTRLRGSLEFATQDPYQDGAAVNDADYLHAAAGMDWRDFGVDLGHEVLEGNGDFGFSTPLATLHAFNGWADVFLATPPDGLEDTYGKVSGDFGRLGWQVVYHEFGAERGGADYGSELDLAVTYPLPFGIGGKLEYADYDSDGFAADTRKIWLTLQRGW